MFEALECGVDVFETSYAYVATERGCAVVFPRTHSTGHPKGVQYEKSRPFELHLEEKKQVDNSVCLLVYVYLFRYKADFNSFLIVICLGMKLILTPS